MPPASSIRARRRLAIALIIGSALLLVAASVLHALDLELESPYIEEGRVWVQVRLLDLFPPRVEESLGRGMPARLQIAAELWRRRSAWFDRMNGSYVASLKIRYDVWTHTYRLEGDGIRPTVVTTLDSLRLALSRPIALPVASLEHLPERSRYYVVASATLKPLSVEDVEEGEDWLSGEVVDKRHAGIGVLTAIPRSLFDAVRNLAGLGDQKTRLITEDFELGDLLVR